MANYVLDFHTNRRPYHKERPGQWRQEGARKRIVKTRGRKCEVCGWQGYLELHHIKPVIKGGDWSDENLILLCEKCHADAHGWKKHKWLDERRRNWTPA